MFLLSCFLQRLLMKPTQINLPNVSFLPLNNAQMWLPLCCQIMYLLFCSQVIFLALFVHISFKVFLYCLKLLPLLSVTTILLCPIPYYKPLAKLSSMLVTHGLQEQSNGSHASPTMRTQIADCMSEAKFNKLQHSERLCFHWACRRHIIWFLSSTFLCSD